MIEDYQKKYELYCKASSGEQYGALPTSFRNIVKTIENDLSELLEKYPPANFVKIDDNFQRYLELLKYYCHFPALFNKKVVAVGGRFSSGKSTFINKLLGGKQLLADINPTTSVPTHLLKGERNVIYAQNFLERVVELNVDEFESLAHDDEGSFGSSVSRLFTSVYIEKEEFHWDNLALLDTPGYSKPEGEDEVVTDKNIAQQQLNSADYIFWLISAEDGTITEDDITFLSKVYAHIPKLIVVNKADKKSEEDIADVISLIKQTLSNRNIKYVDVLPVSARPRSSFSTDVVADVLNQWNEQNTLHPLALEFKKNWLALNQFYQEKFTQAQSNLAKINRIALFIEDAGQVEDVEEFKKQIQQHQQFIVNIQNKLRDYQGYFFQQLTSLGETLGIELKEPTDLEVMRLNPSHSFLKHMREACRKAKVKPQDYQQYLPRLMQASDPISLQQVLRRDSSRFVPMLSELKIQQNEEVAADLLRSVKNSIIQSLLKTLNQLSDKEARNV